VTGAYESGRQDLNPAGAVWTTTRRPTPFRRYLSPDGRFRVRSCSPGFPTLPRGCPTVRETFGRRSSLPDPDFDDPEVGLARRFGARRRSPAGLRRHFPSKTARRW
jgi:hypothetical protein